MTNKETFKVAGGTLVVSKSGNEITSHDMDCGLTETFKFNGSIREFMRDTYNSFEVAAIQL